MKIELLQWLYVAIIAPVFGAIGGWIHGIWQKRRARKRLVSHLMGLPIESKEVLVRFIVEEKHTMRGDPLDPAVRLLMAQGIIVKGPGTGAYDAIDAYLSIPSRFWSVRNHWLISDPEAIQLHSELMIQSQPDASGT